MKKSIAILLVLAMALALVPAAAFASEQTQSQDDGVVYFNLNDEEHWARLNIDQMVLRADNKDENGKASPGLYFNHRFDGDQVVKEQVASYGIAFSLAEGIDFETALKGEGTPLYKNSVVYRADDVVYTKLDGQSFGQKDATATSTLITGIMKEEFGASVNARNAQLPIYGVAYIKLDNGDVVLGQTRERSLQQQVELVDTKFDELEHPQRKSVLKMYKVPTIKSVVDGWNVSNLKNPAKAQADSEKEVFRVLSIGNSHTDNATEYLYNIFQAENPDLEVQVAQLYYSGCSVAQHISFAVKDEAVYKYRTHDNRYPAGYATMRQALNAEIWDVIILHENNNASASEGTYTGVSRRNLEKHINYIKANCLNSNPKFIWSFTWANPTSEYLWSLGYPTDEYYDHVENYKEAFGPELSVMYGNMLEAKKANTRKYIATNDNIADIIPTGLAFKYARDYNPNQEDPDVLLYTDYTHAGPGFGRLLAGYVWYATLMNQTDLPELAGREKITQINALKYARDLTPEQQLLLVNALNHAMANKASLEQ